METILLPWRRYADFQGRSTRTEFWLWQISVIVALLVLAGIPMALAGGQQALADPGGAGLLLLIPAVIFVFAALVPSIAVFVRRLHDSDKTGWLFLLSMIPYIGWIFTLIFGFWPGTKGDNRFGPDPRISAEASANETFG